MYVIVENWHIAINLCFSLYSIFTCFHVSLNASIQIDVFKKVTRKCSISIISTHSPTDLIHMKKFPKKKLFSPFSVNDFKLNGFSLGVPRTSCCIRLQIYTWTRIHSFRQCTYNVSSLFQVVSFMYISIYLYICLVCREN